MQTDFMNTGVAFLAGITVIAGILSLFALLAGRVRPHTLAIGFAGVALQWALAYIAMIGVGLWLGELLFACMVLVPVAVGVCAARFARSQASALGAGLVGGVVNLLIVGSVVGGKDANAAVVEAIVWSVGLLVASGALAAIGGHIARRFPAHEHKLPPPISLFAMVAASTIFLLLVTGGLVTGLEAGLTVPDWPNSFGHNMLLYPISQMKGGVYYEHAHRLFGMLVGLNAFTLAALCWRHETRAWVRWLATAALLMVCVQGLMGGLRVTGNLTLSQDPSLLQPSTAIAIVHGIFGQIVFATVAVIAAVTSGAWLAQTQPMLVRGAVATRTITLIAFLALLLQLFLGACYRHLQIPPTEVGKSITHPTWAMHGHLGFSIVALLLIILAASRLAAIGRVNAQAKPLARAATCMVLIVAIQVALGLVAYAAVLMRRGPDVPLWELLSTTAHQSTGALLLTATVQGAIWSRRLLSPTQVRPIRPGATATAVSA